MTKRTATLYPSSVRALQALGQRIKDARLRRHFSSETVAARADISRQTLIKIEAGIGSVAMGNYFQVLVVLGLDKDINAVARDDILGRRLQDAELPQRQRAPRTVLLNTRRRLSATTRLASLDAVSANTEDERTIANTAAKDKKRDK